MLKNFPGGKELKHLDSSKSAKFGDSGDIRPLIVTVSLQS